jgi:chemotaxis protein CheD
MDQSDIDRYRHERPTRFVMPGYLIVEAEPVVLKTVLGSCVSVCLHDRDRHYGGMNHYLLAEDRPSEPVERYGRTAIRGLVRAFTDRGSLIPSLSAHIVGGAGMIHNAQSRAIGESNVRVAREILGELGIAVVSEDVGGTWGRRVLFLSAPGWLIVERLAGLTSFPGAAGTP